MPTSRATELTWLAKVDSVSVMMSMVSASAATSPIASTPMSFWVRSPLATAVTTLMMPRTWLVRFDAIRLTLSVSSFHVPATPGTRACPPSCPSTPTSRATVLTCSAKVDSVSVMPLMVPASAATSPLASISSFWRRSPLATAVTTLAMPRTWVVRLRAMWLTLSVRFFHTPATPWTSACPPRSPSVPTSRATRVTSDANELSWSTIVLTVSLSSSSSPFTLTVILRDRSPRATAVVTSAMLRTWLVRFDAIELTLSVRSFHTPDTPETSAWPPSLPSLPTSLATRVTSDANERS